MYKYRQVKEKILEDIQKLRPNEKIMSRPLMCRKFKFARTTIDMAINELIQEKVLYTVAGSGTFVSEEYRTRMAKIGDDITSWGVILPDLVSDIYPRFIRGIEDYSQQYNINVVICNTDNLIKKQNEYIDRLIESDVKGLIIIPAIAAKWDNSGFELLRSRNIKYVFCNRPGDSYSDVPLVCSNDFYGGYIATKHLLEKGYRRIAYIARESYKSSIDRYCGYFAALAEENIAIERDLIFLEPLQESANNNGCYQFMRKLLLSPNPPHAFFCFNDRITLQAYRAVREVGKRVSSDIGLIGYDNTQICDVIDPKLTSVQFMGYEMGHKAAQILHKTISGENMTGTNVFLYQPILMVRESCLGREENKDE